MALIVLVGNIGTGKTSFRRKYFSGGEIIICLDEWYGLSKDEECKKLITIIQNGLLNNKTVVVDGPHVTAKSRSDFVFYAKQANCKSIAFDFGPGDNKSLARRIKKSKAINKKTWMEIHYENLSNYEKPCNSEGFDIIITMYRNK